MVGGKLILVFCAGYFFDNQLRKQCAVRFGSTGNVGRRSGQSLQKTPGGNRPSPPPNNIHY